MTHINNKAGIYQIKNLINNKVYIGSSINIKARWNKHISQLRKGIHPNKHLLNSYIKYGENNFLFSILEEITNNSELLIREQFYIDSCEKQLLYNVREQAESNLGIKHSEESKLKNKIASTGRKHKQESKDKISSSNKGKLVSEETKRKMSIAKKGKSNHWKGKKRSEEQRRQISKMAKKRTGTLNANSKLKEEDIQKIKDLYHKDKIIINKIAKLFSVSRSTIKRVLHNKTYINI